MPRRIRKTRRKRGGQLISNANRNRGRRAYTGFKNWTMRTAMPWIKKQTPAALAYLRKNKTISKGLLSYNKNNPNLAYYGNTILPMLAAGAQITGYGRRRRGAKKIKYRRKKGRGLNHTGGSLGHTGYRGGSLNQTGGMKRYRRKRK